MHPVAFVATVPQDCTSVSSDCRGGIPDFILLITVTSRSSKVDSHFGSPLALYAINLFQYSSIYFLLWKSWAIETHYSSLETATLCRQCLLHCSTNSTENVNLTSPWPTYSTEETPRREGEDWRFQLKGRHVSRIRQKSLGILRESGPSGALSPNT